MNNIFNKSLLLLFSRYLSFKKASAVRLFSLNDKNALEKHIAPGSPSFFLFKYSSNKIFSDLDIP